MVVLYDNGDNSDEILRVTSWFTNTERFNLNVIAINRKGFNNKDNNKINPKTKNESTNDTDISTFIKRRKFFQEAGVELNEIHVTPDVEKDSIQFAKLILESIMKYNPDIVITESYKVNIIFLLVQNLPIYRCLS